MSDNVFKDREILNCKKFLFSNFGINFYVVLFFRKNLISESHISKFFLIYEIDKYLAPYLMTNISSK